MADFTHYWTGDTCKSQLDNEGELLDHTASNLFKARGVKRGDRIFVVSIQHGALFLIGRQIVDHIGSYAEAKKRLPYEPWHASDQAFAMPGTASPMRFQRIVPPRMVKQLRFETSAGLTPLKFAADDLLDGQTLRGVRRLGGLSAELLESLLA